MALIAEVVRNGIVECQHHGSAVVLDVDGSVVVSIGEPEQPMMPRSSNKPMQAAAMLRAGLHLPPTLLAVATSSHDGEDMHVARVERILTTAGLDPHVLRCPPAMPGNQAAATARACAGLGPQPILMNCSGKHAAMLATCVINGWPTDTYLAAEHPLQAMIAATIADLAEEPIADVAIDGCGAPIFSISLIGLARAFRRMMISPANSPERQVVDACVAHPLLVSGTDRPDGQLAAAVPGLFAKAGAEGVFAAALPDGRALAVRTHDGASRSTQVMVAELLGRCADGLGAPGQRGDDPAWSDARAVLDTWRTTPVLGGGQPIGVIRAALPPI